jgi:hypothetical protein
VSRLHCPATPSGRKTSFPLIVFLDELYVQDGNRGELTNPERLGNNESRFEGRVERMMQLHHWSCRVTLLDWCASANVPWQRGVWSREPAITARTSRSQAASAIGERGEKSNRDDADNKQLTI